ncbi:head-tail connector protein [Sulfitobacter sp. G21635-S1]|uniref:head-tail connector protein n=1 Tax=Sulfitobacter sp. G21635-S1 TaxID=3014043 RepID=UPI0022AFF061|nr:head-tail connector protein [Sulfitobacter sp. G21635-S1]MCZ4256501.1 head-tail connector protein [Sulfitobacter sp. G21635-S1]
MMLIEVTPAPDNALPVDAFKAHLRLGSGFGLEDVQDAVLVSFLRAAAAAIEARTGKAILRRAFSLELSAWRDAGGQELPLAPVQAVSQVILVAQGGAETEVPATDYWLERDMQAPRLRPAGSVLPRVPGQGSVKIVFEAGFAAEWEGVPSDLRQAVLMLAAHYYEYRNDTGLSGGCMPFGVSSLIERYRAVRMGLGA